MISILIESTGIEMICDLETETCLHSLLKNSHKNFILLYFTISGIEIISIV